MDKGELGNDYENPIWIHVGQSGFWKKYFRCGQSGDWKYT